MSSRLGATEVRDLLRAAFRAQLEPAGWGMLEVVDDGDRLAAFRYALDGEFAATGEVWRASSFPDRPPVLVTNVFVGVSYEPLRRLWPLLDRYEVSVLHEDVWPDVSDDQADGEDGEDPLEVETAVGLAANTSSSWLNLAQRAHIRAE